VWGVCTRRRPPSNAVDDHLGLGICVLVQQPIRDLTDDALAARSELNWRILRIPVVREAELDEAREIILAHVIDTDFVAELARVTFDILVGQFARRCVVCAHMPHGIERQTTLAAAATRQCGQAVQGVWSPEAVQRARTREVLAVEDALLLLERDPDPKDGHDDDGPTTDEERPPVRSKDGKVIEERASEDED